MNDKLVYHDAIVSLIADYSSVLDLLEFTSDFGSCIDQKLKSHQLLRSVFTFEFALCVHLMRDIVGLTNEMSQLLEMRESEVEKAVSLVGMINQKLEGLRDIGGTHFTVKSLLFVRKMRLKFLILLPYILRDLLFEIRVERLVICNITVMSSSFQL
jgi:hypothetical protein